jgi:hypothetical protein
MPSADRAMWRQMTAEADGRFISVECVCSDRAEHHARFERRQRRQDGSRPGRVHGRRFGWAYVESTMKRYQPDENADFVADSVWPVETLVAAVRSVIAGGE